MAAPVRLCIAPALNAPLRAGTINLQDDWK
jgi:hypothetical protein